MHKVEQSVGISVFFDEGLSQERKERIGEEIRKNENVDSAEYISAEEAWEQYKEEVFEGNEDLLEGFGEDNPLSESDSYEVTLKEGADHEKLADTFEKIERCQEGTVFRDCSGRRGEIKYTWYIYSCGADFDFVWRVYLSGEQHGINRSHCPER